MKKRAKSDRVMERLSTLLKEHGIWAHSSGWGLHWQSRYGEEMSAYPHGSEMVEIRGLVPPESAVAASIGPKDTLFDRHPMPNDWIDFGDVGLMAKTDGNLVMFSVEKANKLSEHYFELSKKCNNQRRSLRRLHREVFELQNEIDRLERVIGELAMRQVGYSEGE